MKIYSLVFIILLSCPAWAKTVFVKKTFTTTAGFVRCNIKTTQKQNYAHGSPLFPASYDVAQKIKTLRTGIEYKCEGDVFKQNYADTVNNGYAPGFQTIVYRLDNCQEITP